MRIAYALVLIPAAAWTAFGQGALPRSALGAQVEPRQFGNRNLDVVPRRILSSPTEQFQYNVKNFGAVCDGSTDDTAAIQATYNAAADAMAKQGGAGVVYFPPSTGYCVASILTIPGMDYGHGWLVSLFDNGLFVDTIRPGRWNAFLGRTSNFAGLGGSFIQHPNAEWQQPKGVSAPLVDIEGIEPLYFEGINIESQSLNDPAVLVHNSADDRGTVDLNFKGCVIGSYSQYDMDIQGAFTLNISESSMGRIKLAMGDTTIRDSFVHAIYAYNTGQQAASDLELDNVLSENLANEDFLTVDTSLGPVKNILLHRVTIADTTGESYVLKHINNSGTNCIENVKFDSAGDGEVGSGIVDPASAPNLISLICEGLGCGSVLGQAKNTLYDFMGYVPKGGLTIYGSRYLPNALKVYDASGNYAF